MLLPLSELAVGHTAKVRRVLCDPELSGRLEDLGLTPGLEIRSLHRAPAGSPGAYDIRGAAIALRENDANKILVEAGP